MVGEALLPQTCDRFAVRSTAEYCERFPAQVVDTGCTQLAVAAMVVRRRRGRRKAVGQ